MKNIRRAALLSITLVAPVAVAQQNGLSHSMQNSMDPQVMTNLMNSMMASPTDMMTNPMASCAQCHDGNDMARYQQGMGPFMAMMNPSNWFSPQAYMNMMTGMMDPKTYEVWYNGMMGKYGGMDGAAPAGTSVDNSAAETAAPEAPIDTDANEEAAPPGQTEATSESTDN